MKYEEQKLTKVSQILVRVYVLGRARGVILTHSRLERFPSAFKSNSMVEKNQT